MCQKVLDAPEYPSYDAALRLIDPLHDKGWQFVDSTCDKSILEDAEDGVVRTGP